MRCRHNGQLVQGVLFIGKHQVLDLQDGFIFELGVTGADAGAAAAISKLWVTGVEPSRRPEPDLYWKPGHSPAR